MKLLNICHLEQYWYSLSLASSCELFEIVPLEFHRHSIKPNVLMYQLMRRKSKENASQRLNSHNIAFQYYRCIIIISKSIHQR